MAREVGPTRKWNAGSIAKYLYPYDKWTNGNVWHATRGKDYKKTSRGFASCLYNYARRNAIRVRCEVHKDEVYFQFYPKRDKKGKRVTNVTPIRRMKKSG